MILRLKLLYVTCPSLTHLKDTVSKRSDLTHLTMAKMFKLLLLVIFLSGAVFFAVIVFILPYMFDISNAVKWQPQPRESQDQEDMSSKPDQLFPPAAADQRPALGGPEERVASAANKLQVQNPSRLTAGGNGTPVNYMESVLKTLIRERPPVQVSLPEVVDPSLNKSGLTFDAENLWGSRSNEPTFIPASKPSESYSKGEFSKIHVLPLPREYVDIQQTQLIGHFRRFGMLARQGLGVRYTTPVTEIERRYLATPPLTDLESYPEEAKSKVHLLTHSEVYRVGDSISIRVDLHDQRGRVATRGGDDVRMVLKTSPNCSSPARVADLGNGSYLGTVGLRCTGQAALSVFLSHPREFLRLAVELRHMVLSVRHLTARFKNSQGKIVEATPCLPSQPIPGYSSTCNLSEANGHVPYYCGQPISAGLTCSSPFRPAVMQFYLPGLHGTKQKLRKLFNKKDNFRGIPNNISLRVQQGVRVVPGSPCWSIPPRQTWSLDWNQGWLENKRWHCERCSLPEVFNKDLLVRCLRNVTLLLVGDSNARLMYQEVTSTLGYSQQQYGWHKPRVQEIPWLNSTVAMVPHARPFSPGAQIEQETLSLELLLPALPRDTRYVIVLHYWVHFTVLPLHTYRDRFRQARRCVERFLQSHPGARVLVRGPHAFHRSHHYLEDIGDFYGPWVQRIAWEEFQGLHDSVTFLDLWPLTLASVNKEYHPPPHIVRDMTRVLMGYACQAY